jgi:hypothetical protein
MRHFDEVIEVNPLTGKLSFGHFPKPISATGANKRNGAFGPGGGNRAVCPSASTENLQWATQITLSWNEWRFTRHP